MKHISNVIPKDVQTIITPTGDSPRQFVSGFAESSECPICQGSGWIIRDREVKNPLFGRSEPCECRATMRAAARQAYLMKTCHVPGMYVDAELTFCTSPKGLGEVLEEEVQMSPTTKRIITLSGTFGCGKTTALAATVNHAVATGLTGVYATMADLLDHFRSSYRPGSTIDIDAFWDAIVAADVLALDEIDRWNPTPWAREKFFSLIDTRYRSERGLTLVATNKPIEGTAGILENEPGYLESRLREQRACAIQITMPNRDFRTNPTQRQATLSTAHG